MVSLGNFNTDTIADVSFEPVPPGKYKLVLAQEEIKISKSGSRYVATQMEIIDGQYKGRKIFNNFNLWNASPKAAGIAMSEMKQLCLACGKRGVVGDTAELRGIPFDAEVGVEKRDGFSAQNTIEKYYEAGSTTTTVAAQPAAPASGLSAAQPPPWQR